RGVAGRLSRRRRVGPRRRDLGRRGMDRRVRLQPDLQLGRSGPRSSGVELLDPDYPLAAHPDQVWVDDERLVQVGTRDEVGEGTFFVDHEQDELVLGSSPDGRTVTASALTRALRIRSEGMVVRGIGIRKYAPSVPH